jgi:hypothetical protein
MRAAESTPGGRVRAAVSLGAVLAVGWILLPAPAEAVPAFARQYGVKCSTCHTPVPPRLNNLGITFKRLGYRMPDADDEGKLVLKQKPSHGALDDFSAVGDFRGESHRGEPTTFAVDEVLGFGAGSLGSHLSYNLIVPWEGDAFSLEVAEAQVLLGKPTSNATVRFGKIAPLLWDKGDDTRLGISEALAFSTPVAAGEWEGSALVEPRLGAELGFSLNRLHEGAFRNTFVAVSAFNRLQPEVNVPPEGGQNNGGLKDVLVQALHLWGGSNTIGGLWYHGKVYDIPALGFEDQVDRWALMANYRFKSGTDIVANYTGGTDDSTDPEVGRVKSLGWWVQVDQAIGQRAVASVRYDRFEPNRADASLDVRGPTVAFTYHVLDNLILAAEYQGLQVGSEERSRDIVVRAILAY